jgi:hypothetical protein
MEKLAQEAAVETALLRKAQAERRRRRETIVSTRLGRMVMAALRRQGRQGTLLTANDLKSLSATHQQMLEEVLRPPGDDVSDQEDPDPRSTGPASLDIDLGE